MTIASSTNSNTQSELGQKTLTPKKELPVEENFFLLQSTSGSSTLTEFLFSGQSKLLAKSESIPELIDIALNKDSGKFIAYLDNKNQEDTPNLTPLVNYLTKNDNIDLIWSDYIDQEHNVNAAKNDHLNTQLKSEHASIPDILAFGPIRCAVWRKRLHEKIGNFDETNIEAALFAFLLRAAQKSKAIFYPSPLLGIETKQTNPQQAYYNRLPVYEHYFQKILAGELSPFLPGQDLNTQAKKLGTMIAELNQGITPVRFDLERLVLQCVLAMVQAGNITLAKDLCIDILPVLGNSESIVLALRRIILDDCSPGSCGKPEEGAPLISVVTPLYNQGEYLAEAVHSVRQQNYANWEMIIVNDGSTDDSYNVAQTLINEINDPRIKILSHDNHGKGYTRNRGVKEAKGKYICVLDADDELAPEYLNTAVDLLEQAPHKGWVTPKTLVFAGSNHVAWEWVKENTGPGILRSTSPCSAVYRQKIWKELGGYFEDMTDREDWEFWIRAWEAGWSSTESSEKILFIYRHAFKRFGTIPEINLKSKLEVINLHPWWFKPLSEQEKTNECLYHSVAQFNEKFINTDYIELGTQLQKNKGEFIKFMSWLRQHWEKIYKKENTVPETNLLRMALHYAAKKDHNKMQRYLDQLKNTQLENWQTELLNFIQWTVEN